MGSSSYPHPVQTFLWLVACGAGYRVRHLSPRAMCRAAVVAERVPFSEKATASVEPADAGACQLVAVDFVGGPHADMFQAAGCGCEQGLHSEL